MTRELFDRPPPHDLDAEWALIGGVLVDPSQMDHVGGMVSPSDFHDEPCGQLWGALVMLHESRRPIGDPNVLLPQLREMGIPPGLLSSNMLRSAYNAPRASNAGYYADRIRKLSQLRRLLDTGANLIQRVHERGADPADIGQWLDARLVSLAAGQSTEVRSFKTVAQEVLDELDRPPDQSGAVLTGISSIDETIGAMMPGEVTVLAARTGIGKTSLASQIVVHSGEKDRPALYVSLEMRDLELVQRELCAASGVNSMRVRTRRIDADERRRLVDAAGQLGNLPVFLWSPASATLARIRATAKVHHAKRQLRLLVVDYVGLVQRDDYRIQEHEHIGRVSAGLKQLAKELSLPILVLAQLNRQADQDDPPRLSQLSKSGSIEQDADVVLLLHRPKGDSDTICIVAKNRHGSTGQFSLEFSGRQTRFTPAPPKRHQAFDRFNQGG